MNANSGGDHEFIQREDVGGQWVKLVREMGRVDGEVRQSGFRHRTVERTADGRANSVREQEIVGRGR